MISSSSDALSSFLLIPVRGSLPSPFVRGPSMEWSKSRWINFLKLSFDTDDYVCSKIKKLSKNISCPNIDGVKPYRVLEYEFKSVWNGRCCCLDAKSCLTLLQPRGLQPDRLCCPWDFSSKNTGVSYNFLLQRVFLTQGSNPHLLH